MDSATRLDFQVPSEFEDAATRMHVKDKKHVNEIIKKFIEGGVDRLQVISDFDMTLSRFTDSNGDACDSCYKAVESNELIPQFYRDTSSALKDHYHGIELNPNMSIEEKIPYMVEWWDKAHNLMIQSNIRREWIPKLVRDSKVYLRDGCDVLLEQLLKSQIPLLVFSGGIGDIIEEVFRHRLKLHDNIKVIANFMHFNEDGIMDGFIGDLLHVFNKNEHIIHNSDYFDKIRDHHNVLLMGDSLGDLRMVDGANCKNILKIGFLNNKIEENLEKYIDSFDIVLVNDQTMTVPNSILQHVCRPKQINHTT